MVDRQSLLFMNGVALVALGVAMLLPALADFLTEASDARVFLASAGATLACGGLLLSASGGFGTFTRKTGFIMATLVWITLSLFAALPFTFSGLKLSYVDGVFEAVSGLTTTGATTISKLDTVPKGILLWRALLNWIGGIGIIGMAFVLLPFLQVGGMQIFRTEYSNRADKVLTGARQTAFALLYVYLGLGFACALAYWFGGMSAFDALTHAMSTISTGGFSTHDASFGHFPSPAILLTSIVFMFLAALPFVLFIRLARGEFGALWRDGQVVTFTGIILLTSVAIAILIERQGLSWPSAALQSTFNVVSLLSSTGFSSTDYGLWGPFAAVVFLLLILHGGCSGSTAGGIKTMRLKILVRVAVLQIRRLLDPHAVVVMRQGGRTIEPDVASSVSTFFLIYVLTVFGVAIGLGVTGIDFVTSLTAAAAAVSNVRAGLGDVVGPAGNYASLNEAAKLMLAAGMLLGRLELFTVLVLFTRTFWRS